MIVMDYVGCACTVQVTPGRWSVLAIVMFTERLGTRKVTTKVPRSSRTECRKCRWSIVSHVGTSGHTGIRDNLRRSNERLSVVMRLVYAAENYPDRRSV